ncbi:hypothetical protein THAOC_23992 [Thalassiosira oceanica]|uniref:Condensin II complex subunit H2 N-terminal domain-containing protein n=1 Tax=Thalassiosira oceanica TaxID=159749 RepID=K0RT80_THAOC|nr:hypothetical protein THAOC_23992 [Thalassiosira oceanica]|eukprot:EJK56175.1 hypothetical protein THAOC_23992 [Thalassiosira oceanica]
MAPKRPAPSASSASEQIQPLRDLAANFDLDIEVYLREYLDLVAEDAALSDDEHEAVTNASNFAAAALKIQNSVGIYNRKVDFLHTVVYQVFNEFISTISNCSKNKRRPSKGSNLDADVQEFHEYDEQQEFLLLHDVLPKDESEDRSRINLKEVRESSLDESNLDTTNNNAGTPDVTLLSLGGVMSATRFMDKDGTFVISRQSLENTSPSAMSRMLMSNLQAAPGENGNANLGAEGNLRLLAGMCDVDANGALLMPGTRTSVFVNGQMARGEEETIQIFSGRQDVSNDFEASRAETNNARGENEIGDEDMSFGNPGGNDDFGGADDGAGFELTNDELMDEEVNLDSGDRKEGSPTLEDTLANLDVEDEKKPLVKDDPIDPWATLDPHEPYSKDKPRPLKVGNTIRLPEELTEDDRPSKLVTGSRSRAKASTKSQRCTTQSAHFPARRPYLAATVEDENTDTNPAEAFALEYLPILKSDGLIFGEEFAYIQKMHVKHRDELRKQRRLQRQAMQKKAESPLFDEDEDNISFGGEGGDYNLGDEDNDYGEEYVGPADNAGEDGHQKSNVDFDTIDNVFAQSRDTKGSRRFDADAYLDDGDHDGHRQTFEELCRAHLRQFAMSAEKYAAETQLSRRVSTWQAGLEPMLEEQERRHEFDIHRCGRRILDTVERKLAGRKRLAGGEKKSESKTIDFASVITRDCEEYERLPGTKLCVGADAKVTFVNVRQVELNHCDASRPLV